MGVGGFLSLRLIPPAVVTGVEEKDGNVFGFPGDIKNPHQKTPDRGSIKLFIRTLQADWCEFY